MTIILIIIAVLAAINLTVPLTFTYGFKNCYPCHDQIMLRLPPDSSLKQCR